MIPAIPTIYRGRTYRSRLEARWAAFFDLMGWRYEYEPFDLAGWIPDFALFGVEEILVEVKPYSKVEEYDTEKIIGAMAGTEKEGREVLLLGSTIWKSRQWDEHYCVGWWLGKRGDPYFAEALFMQSEPIGICSSCESYRDSTNRIIGDSGAWGKVDHSRLVGLWNQAGNAVQWQRVTA